ncbi:ABC transporter permease [Tardisphaera saccharovorans]
MESQMTSELGQRLRFVAAFTWFYGYSGMKRGPFFVLSYLSLPLSLLFFIYVISHGAYLAFGVLGGILGIVSGNSLTSVGDFVFLRRELKIQDLLVASRVRAMDYATALMLSNLVYSLPGLILYAVLGALLHIYDLAGFGILVIMVVVLSVSSTSMAMLIASHVRHMRNVWGISSLLSVLLTLLPPLYYPYGDLPKYAFYVLLVSPSTPISALSQWYLGLQPASPLSLIAVLVQLVIYPTLAIKFMKWVDE